MFWILFVYKNRNLITRELVINKSNYVTFKRHNKIVCLLYIIDLSSWQLRAFCCCKSIHFLWLDPVVAVGLDLITAVFRQVTPFANCLERQTSTQAHSHLQSPINSSCTSLLWEEAGWPEKDACAQWKHASSAQKCLMQSQNSEPSCCEVLYCVDYMVI